MKQMIEITNTEALKEAGNQYAIGNQDKQGNSNLFCYYLDKSFFLYSIFN